MQNDGKITEKIDEIKTAACRYLDFVKALNPCAATDRDIEDIIKISKEIELLYNDTDPKEDPVYPDKAQVIAVLEEKAKAHNAKITIEDPNLETERASSLWYGGEIATIEFANGITMCVDAIGDIDATMFDNDGHEIEYVKDKRNGGGFSNLRSYIKNDDDLRNYEASGKLLIDNNNWYEISCIKDRKWYDLQWCSDSDTWWEAIEEAIDGIDDAIKYLEEDA